MDEQKRMQMDEYIKFLEEEDTSDWVTLYKKKRDDGENTLFYSCLIPKNRQKKSLERYDWDLHVGENSYREDAVPILILRQFYGIKPDYWEINGDLRFSFNLFEDKKTGDYYFIDDAGDAEKVISVEEDEIKIKRWILKEYLHVKDLILAQFLDAYRYSKKTMGELGLSKIDEDRSDKGFRYKRIVTGDWMKYNGNNSLSTIMGKKFSGVSEGFKSRIANNEKEFENFIIGLDTDGKEKTFTCNEELLANFFGKNKGNPQYITPIFFRKEVLDKYYSDPEKYKILDGLLSCGGLWSIRIDNDQKEIVVAFLGDLGELPHKEQKHWRMYNIPSGKMSYASVQRNFQAEFAHPGSADLYFKQKFAEFQKAWYNKHGWHLFLPLKKEDEHHFGTLRIPSKESQKEFDDMVMAISKILIDSLNIKELRKNLVSDNSPKEKQYLVQAEFIVTDEDKGIEVLRKYFGQHGMRFPDLIQFLKKLQALRSSGSAHRKGEEYEKIKKKFGLDANYREVFEGILEDSIAILNTLSNKKYGFI